MKSTSMKSAAVVGAALVAIGATAPAATADTVMSEHAGTTSVLQGKLPKVMGNQHRLTFFTDTEGMQYPSHAAKIQSYYCPSGAKITARWASSRCVHRTTSYLTYDKSIVRVSDSMKSARIAGQVKSGTKTWTMDLRLYAQGDVTIDKGVDGWRTEIVDAIAYGNVSGATIRPDARDAGIHRYVRG